VKKPRRRVFKNYALRKELIDKGVITPIHLLAQRLKQRGFEAAAQAVAERIARGLPLFTR
jgi:hypothetical protein